MAPGAAPAQPPSLREAMGVWLRIGCLSFGGPAGQIALLHRVVVEDRRWVGERRFLHALNFCTLLPGPEAQQLAIYLGWLMHGAAGGFAAGLLFVLPGALVMLALCILYATLGALPWVAAVFYGLKCAVLVLVLQALLRVGRRALHGPAAWALASAAFAVLALGVPFPAVVLAAGLAGALAPHRFALSPHRAAADGPPALLDTLLAADPGRERALARGARRAGAACLAAWILPTAALAWHGGRFGQIAWFFSKLAVVTFGGAYAVLAYAAQAVVDGQHWLTAPEMLTGLGLAETTPGPLILVLQFVGFLAGYRAPGALGGLGGGIAGAALTLWATFAPCFALVFLGAPLVERARRNGALAGALSAITAAVVGVIANLAAWFALRVLFTSSTRVHAAHLSLDLPRLASLDPIALSLACIAAIALFAFDRTIPETLALCVTASLALHAL